MWDSGVRGGRDERRVILFTMLDDVIDFFTAGIVGLLGWFFGGIDGFVKVLITFSIIDFITGLMAAYMKRELNSSVGFTGIARKTSMFCLVGVAHIIDLYMLGDTAMLKTSVTLFYAVNEGISIFENVDALGIPIPQFLKDRLFNLKEQMTTSKSQNTSQDDVTTHRSKEGLTASKKRDKKRKQKQGLQETQNLPQESLKKGLSEAIMGYDISGHEVIRHELYTVHNGGANNGPNNGGIHSLVADNVAREVSDDNDNDSDSNESKKESDDGKDEDADTDPDDEDNDDKCVGKSSIGDRNNGSSNDNGAGE